MNLWPQEPDPPKPDLTALCPNCGTPSDPIASTWRDWHTGETFHPTTVLEPRTTAIIAILSLFGATFAANLLLGPDSLLVGLITGGILALAIITILVWRSTTRQAHATRILRYKCPRCLHQWDQQEGKPPPPHNEARQIREDYEALFSRTGENERDT